MNVTLPLRTAYQKLLFTANNLCCGLLLLPFLVRFRRIHPNGAWKIPTHLTRFEKLMLYRLGLGQSPGALMVEIGSYLGASSCFLAGAALEIPKATLHCVDTWENQGMSEGYRDTWVEFQINTKDYKRVIEMHRGRSLDVVRGFNHKIDLVFLDGDHSYEGCHGDVTNWLPLVKPGGCIILHDWGWAEGVQRVVNENIRPLVMREGKLPNLYWGWI